MDAKHAGDFGRLLSMSTIARSLVIEAGLTHSAIAPHPVRLEPAFRRFDPLQTFDHDGQPSSVRAPAPEVWATRRLILPVMAEVDLRRAEAFLAGLAGCSTPMSWEFVGQRKRAWFSLSAPARALAFLTDAWHIAYPESAIVDAPDHWRAVAPDTLVLYDLYSPEVYHRSMRAAVTPWPQLCRLCTHLQDDDLVFCQLIFAPVQHPWQRNIAAMLGAERALGHRAPQGHTTAAKNSSEPLFATVIRIGATTPLLAPSLEAFIGIFTADGKPFRYRSTSDFLRVLSPKDILAMLQTRVTHTTGQFLTSSELAFFVHPPDQSATGTVHLDFLEGLPVPDRLRANGDPLGVNRSRGVPVPVFQPAQYAKSCWVIGASGKGKSSALIHKCRFLAQEGHGVGLIDPHRTTAFALLGALDGVDPERVMFLDFDAATPVAYNPFDHPHEEDYGRLTTDYIHSFKHLFDATGYHRMLHFLGNAIYGAFVLKANLATLPAFFAKTPEGDQLRRHIIATVKNDAVRRFWQDEFPTHSRDAFAPIVNRLSALLLDDRTHRTFAQQDNRVDMAQAMDAQKIVIVAPPASIEAAGIVGGILIAQAKHAAFRRAGTPRAAQHFHLTIDEFHRFITSSTTLQSIIDEAAKGGLSVGLANQETGQIPGDLLKAMYSIPNIFVFGVNLPDAKHLAHLFNGQVTPETLASQPTGSVYARIGQDIVNYDCPLPFANPNPATAARIIAHSEATYYAASVSATPGSRRVKRVIESF